MGAAGVSDREALPLADAVTVLHAALHPEAWPELPPLPPLGRGRKRNPEAVPAHKRRRLALETDASRWTAALLEAAQVPQSVIIAIVGHSSYASTRRYSHAEMSQARTALSDVAEPLQLG